jgi:putative two-component system response regulator
LVIDDDPVAREVMQTFLISDGYRVVLASDGKGGLAKATRLHPDVILLDMAMPMMDGLEVCRRLRATSTLAEVPILMITAHDDRDMRLSGLEAGVDDFLSKPFDRLELRARLKTITRLDRYRKLNQERSKLEQALRGLEEGHRQLQQAYEEIIVGWSRAMDLRDKETEGHSQRVANMTVTLAREMGMDEEALVHIYRGALLHDLGKLGIPDQILLKPGSLTESEWSVMRQHPNFAYNMLSPITYLRPALDIPYCHHEKWNGLGYPRGLKGNEIPLAARIFAVADVWDALTSDRPYRPAWSEADALQYIHSQAGEHFDPQVVETFEPMINSDKR